MFDSNENIARLFKFVFWGGLNTAISFLVYCAGVFYGLHIFIASLISLLAGILLGHYFNKNNVFASKNKNTLRKYALLWSSLYLVNIIILSVFIKLGFNNYAAGALAGFCLIPISFIFQKRFIFH